MIRVARFGLSKSTYDLNSWQFHGFCPDADQRAWRPLLHSREVTFVGRDVRNRPIRIERVHYRRQSGHEVWVEAPSVSVGEPVLDEDCDYQHIGIVLWPTPFAEPETPILTRWWDGRIGNAPGEEPVESRTVNVDISGHLLRLSQHFAWE